MKWVLVIAMLTNGHLQYSEGGPHANKQDCEAVFQHLIDLYLKDGVRLEDINGGCYRVEELP